MHMLRQFADGIEGLKGFVAEVASNPVTQGVVLDINPAWLVAFRLDRAGLQPFSYDMRWSIPSPLGEDLLHLESFEGDTIDFKWEDKTRWVYDITHHLTGRAEKQIAEAALPFIVKVIAKPVGFDFFEARARLVALARQQNFLALVETRPLGMLAISPGDACLAGNVPGTIGGFLRDQKTGGPYAATCGHVVSKGTNVSVLGKHLGICSYSHAPQQLALGQTCIPSCPSANKLDLALIDVGNATVTNVVTGVAAHLAFHQSIVLRGGMSHVNKFEVGGLVITYRPGNSNVCFENMFEVRPPSTAGIINPRLRAAVATVPIQGDSGGWLETASKEWGGVLVAADHLMGYALEADKSMAEADATFGTRLHLV